MAENQGGDSSPDQQHPDIYPDDPYGGGTPTPPAAKTPAVRPSSPGAKPGGGKPPGAGGGSRTPPPPPPEDPEEEDDGMLRMSFLEHLGELRTRIIRALMGFGVVFLVCIIFAEQLWTIVQAPAAEALKKIGSGQLVAIDPMEKFSIIWMWTPLVAAIFLASPWILYQIWAFIAPGLYKRERKWAIPFVLCTAGLFLAGGFFAYFVAFRYGLTFLLGIYSQGVTSMISINLYFDLFVDVMLGVALVFELPVIIFFLVLLRLASPSFLMTHSRYAILAIVILAAIITPTPDVFNLMLFAVPMCALFFVGVFAGYLLVLHRENRKFPWVRVITWTVIILLVAAAILWLMITKYHYHFVPHPPFLIK